MSCVRMQLPDLVSEWFRISNFAVEQDSVSEGAKHLFSLCEKRYFVPVQNCLRLIRTV